MSDLLNPEQRTQIRGLANDFLLRAALIRLMLFDPGFAEGARHWFDSLFGQFSATDLARAANPQFIITLREEYLHLLERAERFAANAPKAAPAPARPKSIRRRIFEWFERG
jgi:hypothetical protein